MNREHLFPMFPTCMFQGWIQSSSSDFQKSLKIINVSKSAFLISQVLYCSSRNQLSFLFYCLLWNKTKKNLSYLVILLITQQSFLRRIQQVFALRRYFWEQADNIWRHVEEKLYAGGGIGVVYGSFHKSLKTLFDWPETLTLSCELLKLECKDH